LQKTEKSGNIWRNDINFQSIHEAVQTIRGMMKIISILDVNVNDFLAAVARKHDNQDHSGRYMFGGCAVAVYAGLYFFVPGASAWLAYSWVTGSLTQGALVAGGIGGVISSAYGLKGAYEESGATKLRNQGTYTWVAT
jgi:hypothetical protein